MLELSVHRRKTKSFPGVSHTIILCTTIFVRKVLLINRTFLLPLPFRTTNHGVIKGRVAFH